MDILLQDPVSLAAQAAEAVKLQRQYFATNITKKLDFRRRQLTKLRQLLVEHEDEIIKALHSDLHKHEFEAYATEVGFVVKDLDKALSKLDKWAAPQAVSTPLFHFKANSYTMAEPYGNTLIIAPWNYPFHNVFNPVSAALFSGNAIVIKVSEYASWSIRYSSSSPSI
jgi:aldehyde dehydrogenase (NAD+)